MSNNNPFVAILMGSDSELPVMQFTLDTLKSLNVDFEVKIMSAHRTPVDTKKYVAEDESRGCAVFIAAAGLVAHLAGTIAADTLQPVIGVPMDSGPLKGMDALLSTVQMPAGIPVGTVAIGNADAKNAAYLAAKIIGVADAGVAAHLKTEREAYADAVRAKDAELQKALS